MVLDFSIEFLDQSVCTSVHASSFKMETCNKSESEDDSISSTSAKSFTLEMPIENQEGESELQEDSSKVNTENSE